TVMLNRAPGSGPGGGTPPPGGGTPPPAITGTVALGHLRFRRGVLVVRVTVNTQGALVGTLSAKKAVRAAVRRLRVLGKGKATATKAETVSLRIRLNRRARHLLAKRRHIAARLSVRFTPSGQPTVTRSRAITLRVR